MATITGGEDFSATPTGVTGTRLDDHVNNATISNVAQADMAASTGAIVRSASAPSDTDAGWWDTANNVFRIHDGASWTPVATGALLTNKSGGQVIAGDVVVADTTTNSSFKTSTTSGDSAVLGTAAETIAADSSGVVLYGGIQNVLITGTVNRGEFLLHSTTAKKATSTTTKTSGSFGIALATGTDTLISCLVTGTVVSLSASTVETVTANWVFSGNPDFTGTPTYSNLATQAQMETATATNVPVSPNATKWHPGVAKAWCKFDGAIATPAMDTSYNFDSSITDNSTGNYTVTLTTDMSGADYAIAGIVKSPTLNYVAISLVTDGTQDAGTISVACTKTNDGAQHDADVVCLVAFGDQ